MATTTGIPLSEYLATSYSPDCDFLDGELQERNLGEIEHAKVQAAIAAWFYQHRKQWELHVLPEVRIQISATRFRVADLCLVAREAGEVDVVRHAPLAIIEILSPEDRVSRYHERLADYRKMGALSLWIVDPQARQGYDCSSGNWIRTLHFQVPGTPIALDLAAIFAELD
jgi:Uma2 family endonuclease